jgi:hypothetical protein
MDSIAERIHYNATKHALDSINNFGFYKCFNLEKIAKDIKELFDVDVKIGSGVLLKMDYFDKNVHVHTTVVINQVLHKVVDKFVYCNHHLNCKSWDTTEQKELCNLCFDLNERNEMNQSMFGDQLTLF